MATLSPIAQQVRDALFLAASRTYAEQYVEPFIRQKFGLLEPTSDDHDALGQDGTRYEIKACKVMTVPKNGKSVRTLIQRVLFENDNLPTNRMVSFDQHKTQDYLANVQNVKRDHFDYLIYVLLFADCVKVFMAHTTSIRKGAFQSWSDKHGRYDELGKSGQFGITKTTIGWHLKNTLRETIDYEEVASIFEHLSVER